VHAVLPCMIRARKGVVVSVGSDAGRVGEYREAVYSACKVCVCDGVSDVWCVCYVCYNYVCVSVSQSISDVCV